jgi:hypothetical protein
MEMSDNTPHPMTIVKSAQLRAINIGLWCSVSFLCSVRGLASPGIATIGHFAAILAVYKIFKSIIKYRLFEQDIKFGKCLRMAFLLCIFAGLLTNVVQYVYFQFFDNGFFLSSLATMMETPEYQQMLKSVFSDIPQSELNAAIQQINIPTLMTQIIFMNLIISVPVSFLTAALAAYPTISKTSINQSEQNIEKE